MSVTRVLRSLAIALVAFLAALAAFLGVGDKGPIVSDSISQLKTEIDIVLSASFIQNVRVIDDAALDIPCGRDRAKRRYEITATRFYPGLDAPAELVDEITGRLLAVYTLAYRRIEPGDGLTGALRDKKSHTNIAVRSPARGQIWIIGTTDCLRTS